MRDKLRALIDQLRLHGMAEVLDAELARAEREAIPAAELLVRLLGQERRGARRTQPGLSSRAGASAVAVVARQLPLRDRQPGVSKTQIQTLAGLDFLVTDRQCPAHRQARHETGLALGLLRQGLPQRPSRPLLQRASPVR